MGSFGFADTAFRERGPDVRAAALGAALGFWGTRLGMIDAEELALCLVCLAMQSLFGESNLHTVTEGVPNGKLYHYLGKHPTQSRSL